MFFKPLLSMLLSFTAGNYKQKLLNHVEQLNATVLTNDQKRKAAFDSLKADFMADVTSEKGKKVRDSVINLAVEAAVVYLSK